MFRTVRTARGVILLSTLGTVLTGGLVGWLSGFFATVKDDATSSYHQISHTVQRIDLVSLLAGIAMPLIILVLLVVILSDN